MRRCPLVYVQRIVSVQILTKSDRNMSVEMLWHFFLCLPLSNDRGVLTITTASYVGIVPLTGSSTHTSNANGMSLLQ